MHVLQQAPGGGGEFGPEEGCEIEVFIEMRAAFRAVEMQEDFGEVIGLRHGVAERVEFRLVPARAVVSEMAQGRQPVCGCVRVGFIGDQAEVAAGRQAIGLAAPEDGRVIGLGCGDRAGVERKFQFFRAVPAGGPAPQLRPETGAMQLCQRPVALAQRPVRWGLGKLGKPRLDREQRPVERMQSGAAFPEREAFRLAQSPHVTSP